MTAKNDGMEQLNAALGELSSYGLAPVTQNETSFFVNSGTGEVSLRVFPEMAVFCLSVKVENADLERGVYEEALAINSAPDLLSGNNRLFCDSRDAVTIRLGSCVSLERTDAAALKHRILDFLQTFPEDLSAVRQYMSGEFAGSDDISGDDSSPSSVISGPDYVPGLDDRPFSVSDMTLMMPGMMAV